MAGMYRSRVAGTGSYLPPGVLTNADLEKMVDTNDQWIVERTGIQRRHMASDIPESYQATSDLSLIASQEALKDADVVLFEEVAPRSNLPSLVHLAIELLSLPGGIAELCDGF